MNGDTSAAQVLAGVRPREADRQHFRASGAWRDQSSGDDLAHWAAATPDAPAVVATSPGRPRTVLSWQELARQVERYAAALAALGVHRGDVVSMQLPNWWQVPVLTLACWQRGAIVAPIMTTMGARETERMLARVGATVTITTGEWQGRELAAPVAQMAARLPALRHRIVLAGTPADDEIDFDDFFGNTEHPTPGEPVSDPDAAALVLFTSGTTGEPKASVRTQNITYAQTRGVITDARNAPLRRFYTAQSLMHVAAHATWLATVAAGACIVLAEPWDTARCMDLLADERVDQLLLVPPFLAALVATLRAAEVALPALQKVMTAGTTVPTDLVEETTAALGVDLTTIWAMTEGGSTSTTDDDPPGWGARSVGRPGIGTETQLRPVTPGASIDDRNPGRLMIRGASVGLATVGRDSGAVHVITDHDDGWYDTGDLAVRDGRGGYRLSGRVADRVGGAFMIPLADVEDVLRAHPDITDVAVVGHNGNTEGCAVVVAGAPVDLAVVRDHLRSAHMTEWYWPTRVEQVDQLPRNAMGKVEKATLRSWLVALPS